MTEVASRVASLALVLRRSDFSETSQVGQLYFREIGRASGLAKGIKRKGATLRGPLDLFVLAEAEVLIRPRSDLHLLTRYRVVTGYPGLRRNLERLGGAFVVTEILREGTSDHDASPELFDRARQTLEALESAHSSQCGPILAWWALEFLRHSGWLPSLEQCVVCGRTAPEGRPVRVPLSMGGVVCRECLGQAQFRLWTLPPPVRQVLSALVQMSEPAEAADLAIDERTRIILREFLGNLLQYHLDRELRTLPAWEA